MRVYDKNIAEQVFTQLVLWNNVLKNVATNTGAVNGKYLTVHYGRNIGSAAGSETVTLPTAGYQKYNQAVIPMKKNYHQIEITDLAIQASKNSMEYLVNLLDAEVKGAKEDMKRQLSRQGYGDGSGVICQIDGIGSSPTFNLKNPMVGKDASAFFEGGAAGVGTPVMVDSSKTTATSEVYTIVSSVTDADTITLATGTGVADGDYVFMAHNNGTATPTVSNRAAEITGLKALVDDGTNLTILESIDRSSNAWWKSYVNSNSTQRSLTNSLLQTTFLESKKMGNPKFALTSFDVYAAYGELLSADRRYTDTMELKGGFKGVSFNGLPMIADYDAPYDEVYFIDPTTLSVEELAPMSFMDEDGSMLARSATTPAFQGTLRYYSNLAISAPNKNSALRDVIA